MEKMYWDQFLHSGKIKDYLSYKIVLQTVSLQNGKMTAERRNNVNQIVLTGMVLSTTPVGNMTAGSFCLQKNREKYRHLPKAREDRTVRLSE